MIKSDGGPTIEELFAIEEHFDFATYIRDQSTDQGEDTRQRAEDRVGGEPHPTRKRFEDFIKGLTESERAAVIRLHLIKDPDHIDLVIFPEREEELIKKHNNSSKGFEFVIKPSLYGHGLFNGAVGVSVGEEIGEYRGTKVPAEIADDLPVLYNKIVPAYEEGYSIVGDVVDPANFNYCAYANDPGYYGSKLSGFVKGESNVELVSTLSLTNRPYVAMKCSKRIKPGEELLLFYGYEYWEGDEHYFPDKQTRRDAQLVIDRKRKGRNKD